MRVRVWCAAALVFAAAPALAQGLPEYECHPQQEGRGEGFDEKLETRVGESLKMPVREAISALEDLRKDETAGSYADGVLLSELAWRYHEARRPADAGAAALAVLRNTYVEGRRVDAMRAVLAQIDADAGTWRGVVDALGPVAEKQCRPVASVIRYLLATAHVRLGEAGPALIQIDAAEPQDDAEGVQWMRTALTLDCSDHPGPVCAVRVLRYAQTPGPSAGLQALLNAELARLKPVEAVRPMLDESRQAGLLDANYVLVPRPPKVIEELRPTVRIAPTYPHAALRRGQQGYVTLDITVGPDGRVLQAKVADASPPGVFDDVAVKAAEKGRFQPTTVNGQAVETRGRYTIKFLMDR